MAPLDFSNYVPGIPNTGPGWNPPTVTQLLAYIQAELKKIKTQIGDLTEQEVDDLIEQVSGLAGDVHDLGITIGEHTEAISQAQGDISDIQESLGNVIQDIADINLALAGKAAGNTTGAAKLTASIPYAVVDDTSTSTAFTATVPGITEYKNGVSCMLRNGVVTSASGCTLNVNGLGAKPIYSSMAAATAVTTIFNVNYTMLFVYDENRVTDGCWVIYYGYNANDNTIAYQIRNYQQGLVMKKTLYRYMFAFTNFNNELVPSCNTSNSTAVTKTLATDAFDPHGNIFYYSTTSSVSAGSSPGASNFWRQYNACNMRYAWNVSSTQLTVKPAVYVRVTPQADGSVVLDGNDCIVQALPTTADGKYYIYLGQAYSAYQIELDINHPVYKYDSGAIVTV